MAVRMVDIARMAEVVVGEEEVTLEVEGRVGLTEAGTEVLVAEEEWGKEAFHFMHFCSLETSSSSPHAVHLYTSVSFIKIKSFRGT